MYKEHAWRKKGVNHIMVWVRKDLIDPLVPTLCPGEGHFPLDKIFQSLIKPGLEPFQGICKVAVTHRGNELLLWKFILMRAHFQSSGQPRPSPAGREEVSGLWNQQDFMDLDPVSSSAPSAFSLRVLIAGAGTRLSMAHSCPSQVRLSAPTKLHLICT